MSHHEHISTAALAHNRLGMRALLLSLMGLMATAALQGVIVVFSGSVALLGDTLHNLVDAFTAIPLGIAFFLQRRKPDKQFTYGYSRFEDIAGGLIVLLIFGTAIAVALVSVAKLRSGFVVHHVEWVAAAAIIGFIGNELVARYRIKIGREIDSPALIADGEHARADGFTSLGVLAGAIGVYLGYPLADPLVGFALAVMILKIGWDSGRDLLKRLADATEPEMIDLIKEEARAVSGVMDVIEAKARSAGRELRLDLTIVVEGTISVIQGHEIAIRVQHALQKKFPRIVSPNIHVDPSGHTGEQHHFATHHQPK